MNQKTSFFKIHSIVRVCRYWGGIEVMFHKDIFYGIFTYLKSQINNLISNL